MTSPHDLEPFRPRDRGELSAIVSDAVGSGHGYVLVAAGTDFVVETSALEPGEASHGSPVIVDVSLVEGLRGVSISGETLRIGAISTYLDILTHAEACRRAPLLARMVQEVLGDELRSRTTLGGEIANGSPQAEGAAVVAAYDAVLTVESVRGERQVSFSELQTSLDTSSRSPDEIIVAVDVPLARIDAPWFWRRADFAFDGVASNLALAAIAEVSGGQLVRLGLGMTAVAPVTALLRRTRQLGLSTGLPWISSAEIEKAVAADISPGDDELAARLEREALACALVREFFRSVGARI